MMSPAAGACVPVVRPIVTTLATSRHTGSTGARRSRTAAVDQTCSNASLIWRRQYEPQASVADHCRAAACERLATTDIRRGADGAPDISPASDRSGVAVRGELEATRSRRRGTSHQGAFAARRLCRRIACASLRASVQGTQESLLPRRRGRADPVARLGRRLDVASRASTPSPPRRRTTSSPRSISRGRTICGWWSRAAATAIREHPTPPTRF